MNQTAQPQDHAQTNSKPETKEYPRFRIKAIEGYYNISYVQYEDGKVKRNKVDEEKVMDDIDTYKIQMITKPKDTEVLQTLTELRDTNIAEMLLDLLEQGYWTREDVEDYTHAQIQDDWQEKVNE